MTHIWIPNKEVICPLCDQTFHKQKFAFHGKVVDAYMCRTDKIVAFPFDPMFDKWRDHDKQIPCPHCETPMKWFGRMIDCYVKMVCPRCDIVVEKDSDMTFNGKGGVEIEDMNQPKSEVVDLQIPINKLKLTPEKRAQLVKKLREKRGRDGK